MATAIFQCRVAWWLRFYLAGVYMMALTTGAEPDWEKVKRVALKAVKLRALNH